MSYGIEKAGFGRSDGLSLAPPPLAGQVKILPRSRSSPAGKEGGREGGEREERGRGYLARVPEGAGGVQGWTSSYVVSGS